MSVDENVLCIPHYTQDTFMTFFEGEIISKDHPFLTRKWVCNLLCVSNYIMLCYLCTYRRLMLELTRITGLVEQSVELYFVSY